MSVWTDGKCDLCPEPVREFRIATHDHRTLLICGDCVRRFGVDEWLEVCDLITGQSRVNTAVL